MRLKLSNNMLTTQEKAMQRARVKWATEGYWFTRYTRPRWLKRTNNQLILDLSEDVSDVYKQILRTFGPGWKTGPLIINVNIKTHTPIIQLLINTIVWY